jgi:TusA-related sulfurtransferase
LPIAGYKIRFIDGLKSGEELEVLTDDVAARNAIPLWTSEHGHEI